MSLLKLHAVSQESNIMSLKLQYIPLHSIKMMLLLCPRCPIQRKLNPSKSAWIFNIKALMKRFVYCQIYIRLMNKLQQIRNEERSTELLTTRMYIKLKVEL